MAVNLFPYMQKKAALGQGYASKTAANTYSQFLAQQRGNRQMADVRQQFKAQTPKVMNAYLRRGLSGPGVRSGVYERGLSDFAKQQTTAENETQQAINEAIDALRQQRVDMDAEYQRELADLELQKANEQAQAAATLLAFRPYMGG